MASSWASVALKLVVTRPSSMAYSSRMPSMMTSMECAASRKPEVRATQPHMSRKMPRYLPMFFRSSRGSRLASGVMGCLPIQLGGAERRLVDLVLHEPAVA